MYTNSVFFSCIAFVLVIFCPPVVVAFLNILLVLLLVEKQQLSLSILFTLEMKSGCLTPAASCRSTFMLCTDIILNTTATLYKYGPPGDPLTPQAPVPVG